MVSSPGWVGRLTTVDGRSAPADGGDLSVRNEQIPAAPAPIEAGAALAGAVPDASGPDGMQAGIETPIID